MKKLFFSIFLLFFIGSALNGMGQEAMPSTETVMNKAYAQASKEHKKVLVIFHASWCGWCKKMEASINDPSIKKFFDDHFVTVYLDVLEQPAKKSLENPGAMEFLTKYKGEKSGLPFWFISDANGNKLADSQKRPAGASLDTYGDNIGCPATEEEVASFVAILKKETPLNDQQLSLISQRFAQNRAH